MTQYTPSVDLAFFPRVNQFKTFTPRAYQRSDNGRIFGRYGVRDIDNEQVYPPADGADCLELIPQVPIDLGPDVTVTPTALIDLRLCNGVTDLQFTDIDNYPPASGADCLGDYDLLPLVPLDLGPDVTTTPTGLIDLRVCDNTFDLQFSDIDDYPVPFGTTTLSSESLPIDLGPNATTTPSGTFDLRVGSATIELNPLN